MRAPTLVLVTLGALSGLGFSCGRSNDEPAAAGNAGLISVGSAGAGVGSAGAGVGSAGGEAAGGSDAGLLDCDPGKVLCKRAAPECAFGEAPQVIEHCYGECVKVERCGCSMAAQCPQPEQYTCWSKRHCGPFVN
jgi:hypothetical protein